MCNVLKLKRKKIKLQKHFLSYFLNLKWNFIHYYDKKKRFFVVLKFVLISKKSIEAIFLEDY